MENLRPIKEVKAFTIAYPKKAKAAPIYEKLGTRKNNNTIYEVVEAAPISVRSPGLPKASSAGFTQKVRCVIRTAKVTILSGFEAGRYSFPNMRVIMGSENIRITMATGIVNRIRFFVEYLRSFLKSFNAFKLEILTSSGYIAS